MNSIIFSLRLFVLLACVMPFNASQLKNQL